MGAPHPELAAFLDVVAAARSPPPCASMRASRVMP